MNTCARVDCNRRRYALQHCRKHYNYWRLHGTLIFDEPSDIIDARPLIHAVEDRLAGRALNWLIPDLADQRAFYRSRQSGRITEVVADRIAVRALRMTIDEVY